MSQLQRSGRYTYINKVTAANEELIVKDLFDPRHTNPKVKKMSVSVNKDCLITINKQDEVLIRAGLGFNIEYEDNTIDSLVCKEADVTFYAIVAY